MNAKMNLSDVPQVAASDLDLAMRFLIAKGQGLALLKGLTEKEIRQIEEHIWTIYEGSAERRLALALRFRALLDVFAARRLKQLLIERGFKVIAAAIAEASEQRLNTRFGFSAQKLLLAIEEATCQAAPAIVESLPLRAAA